MSVEINDVSPKLGEYLLKGWTMLGTSCVDHPSVPLMRERGGTKCICVLCDDKYYVEDGENLLMYMKQQPKKEEEQKETIEKKEEITEMKEEKQPQKEEKKEEKQLSKLPQMTNQTMF